MSHFVVLLKSDLVVQQNPSENYPKFQVSPFQGTTTLSITTFSIASLSIKGLQVTFSKMTLNVIMLSVVMRNVVMLNVVGPFSTLKDIKMLTTANQQFTLSIIFFTNV
jgi:hypothetical protein